jgi:hypothetical protein
MTHAEVESIKTLSRRGLAIMLTRISVLRR